jgi:hypothetical protein
MSWRHVLLSCVLVSVASCGPHLPPTTVPPPPAPELTTFRQALVAYVTATQPYRKTAASQGASEPEDAVRRREQTMATALRTTVRPRARQGDIFDPMAAAYIRKGIAALYASPRHDLLVDELREQTEGEPAARGAVKIGVDGKSAVAPPLLIAALPPLPEQLEYDIRGRALILRDVDANVVVDYIADALPATPPVTAAPAATAPSPAGATFLALPQVRGGTVFGVMGDSGSGDEAQRAIASALLEYFTSARRFGFVLMLGDNLYHDDYQGEFLEPYKPLLDRGVSFYATLGNHDRDLEQHFAPFHMQDQDHYSFDKGNARFVALNSNHPEDQMQLAFMQKAFADAGSKWRIAFFHHPLYSSGEHASESARVIRPALESALTRSGVNVVFSGHEHLYERVAPQHGIHYFVSGGGGRYLYHVTKSSFDQVAVSTHHFMMLEVTGDELFFEALQPDGRVVDCGVDWRTDQARAKGPDETTREWLDACAAARSTRPAPTRAASRSQ